ncbi:MAG: hypothetical protein WC799_15745 [Desulfobacteraceae bacterium]
MKKNMSGMDEIEELTKRFKDYIDKIQAAFDTSSTQKPGSQTATDAGSSQSSKKLYTVVSPVDAMASNLQSVLNAIDKAILNMDQLATNENDSGSGESVVEGNESPGQKTGVIATQPNQEKFSVEELDFLVKTFNSVLNSSEEERKKIFSQFEKKDTP